MGEGGVHCVARGRECGGLVGGAVGFEVFFAAARDGGMFVGEVGQEAEVLRFVGEVGFDRGLGGGLRGVFVCVGHFR